MTENKKKRFEPFSENNWWKFGVIWGVFMFLLMLFVIRPYLDEEYTPTQKLIDLIVWSVGGIGYGAIMRWFKRKSEGK